MSGPFNWQVVNWFATGRDSTGGWISPGNDQASSLKAPWLPDADAAVTLMRHADRPWRDSEVADLDRQQGGGVERNLRVFEGHSDDLLLTACWCGRGFVWLPRADVGVRTDRCYRKHGCHAAAEHARLVHGMEAA